jgi:hypothetical protein
VNGRDVRASFEALIDGTWSPVLAGDAVPPSVLEDSRGWAEEVLCSNADPFREARGVERRMLYGVGFTPDVLVTSFAPADDDEPATLRESLQHFAVSRGWRGAQRMPAEREDLLGAVRSRLLPLLSAEAARVLGAALDAAPDAAGPRAAHEPVLLTSSWSRPVGPLDLWSDHLYAAFAGGRLYVDVLKLYPRFAAVPFRPGLDWFPRAPSQRRDRA